MIEAVVDVLECPVCAGNLRCAGRTLRCGNGHSFDVARSGYVSLLAPDARTDTADTAAMVASREAFLGAGHYDPIADAVCDALASALGRDSRGCVAEIGAGTGFYLARVLDRFPGLRGVAFDISKPALRRAARAHARSVAVAADTWSRLPVRDGALLAVLDVFSPRNAAELARVLAPSGILAIVTPRGGHLRELVGPVGLLTVDVRKQERLAATLGRRFEAESSHHVAYSLLLPRAAVRALIEMGPSARHIDPATLAERVRALPEPFRVSVDVDVSIWRLVGSASSRRTPPSGERSATG
ncbi:MAG: putative RNA methyltransferase [Coriobacteriales bacterium]